MAALLRQRRAARDADRPGRVGEDAARDRVGGGGRRRVPQRRVLGAAGHASRPGARRCPTIAQAVGAQGDLAAHVGEREQLLLVDNLEQVIDAAPALGSTLEACPNLKLLVTSRELLRVQGEVEYEVLPLATPEAVELFCLRAQLPEGPRSRSSAAASTTCRSRSSSPRRARRRSRRSRSSTGSASGSTCSRAAATPSRARPRCARRSSGATSCCSPRTTAAVRAARRLPGLHARGGGGGLRRGCRRLQSLVEKSLAAAHGRALLDARDDPRARGRAARRERRGGRDSPPPRRVLPRRRRVDVHVGRAGGSRADAARHRAGRAGQLPRGARLGGRARSRARPPHRGRAGAVLGRRRTRSRARGGSRRCSSARADLPRRAAVRPPCACSAARPRSRATTTGRVALYQQSLADLRASWARVGHRPPPPPGRPWPARTATGRARATLLEENLVRARALGSQFLETEALGGLAHVERSRRRRRARDRARRAATSSCARRARVQLVRRDRRRATSRSASSSWAGSTMPRRAALRRSGSCAGRWTIRGSRRGSLLVLAVVARRRGDDERAGRLWGAVEAERERGPGLGRGGARAPAARRRQAAGRRFEAGREAGRRLSLEEATDEALGQRAT